jgi:hypothetical protein
MKKTLAREDDRTFREPIGDEGKPGLAYHLIEKHLDLHVREIRKIAQNLSDREFMSQKWEEGRPDDYIPTDQERPQYGLNSIVELQPKRKLGFIDENGTELTKGPVYFEMHTRTKANDRDQVWFYPADEYNDREGIYFSVYVSEARMLWLWEQMHLRPNAEVIFSVEAMLWQHEVDAALAEHDQWQDFHIEKTKRAEIVGCTFLVKDHRASDREDAGAFGHAPQSPVVASPVKAPNPEAISLGRLVKAGGWVIALLALILIAVLVKG